MNPGAVAFTDHREEARVSSYAPARFEAPHAIFSPSGSAILEEASACGLRLRTETPLHPDEELVVKIAGKPFRLHARVVWVKEQPPLHFGGRKTWIAGCRLDPESIGHVPLVPAMAVNPFPWRTLLEVVGAAAVVGLLVYLLITFLFARLGAAIG